MHTVVTDEIAARRQKDGKPTNLLGDREHELSVLTTLQGRHSIEKSPDGTLQVPAKTTQPLSLFISRRVGIFPYIFGQRGRRRAVWILLSCCVTGARCQAPVRHGSGAFGDIPLSRLLHLAISSSQFLGGRGIRHRSDVSNTTSHHNKLRSSASRWGSGAS